MTRRQKPEVSTQQPSLCTRGLKQAIALASAVGVLILGYLLTRSSGYGTLRVRSASKSKPLGFVWSLTLCVYTRPRLCCSSPSVGSSCSSSFCIAQAPRWARLCSSSSHLAQAPRWTLSFSLSVLRCRIGISTIRNRDFPEMAPYHTLTENNHKCLDLRGNSK